MPPMFRRSGSQPMTMSDIKTRLASTDRNNNGTGIFPSAGEKNDPVTTKIPIEITAQIFRCYVQLQRKGGDIFNEPTFGFDEIPVGAPLRIGAVCRRWREIAWGIPALWTNLVADLLSKGHVHGPEFVSEWLERSAELPVGVALRLHTDASLRRRMGPVMPKGRRRRDAEAVVDVLIKYSRKLKSVDLRDVPWHLVVMLNSDTPSALENLCLGPFTGLKRRGLGLFRQTPHKHSPTGFSLLSTVRPTLLKIYWSKMTTLNIARVTRVTVFEVIALCPSTLRRLTLKDISDDIDDWHVDTDWLPTRVVNLPGLLSISFHEMGTQKGFAETFFDHITAPALSSFWYFGLEVDHEMPVGEMITFIERSSCKITHLQLHDPFFVIPDLTVEGNDYMTLLRNMPSLRELDISLGTDLSIEPLFLVLGERETYTDLPMFLPDLEDLNCIVYPTFEWALFPEIWMASPSTWLCHGHPDLKCSEIVVAPAREKLCAALMLRGPSDNCKGKCMDEEASMALAAIKRQITAEISVTTDSRGKTALGGHKFSIR